MRHKSNLLRVLAVLSAAAMLAACSKAGDENSTNEQALATANLAHAQQLIDEYSKVPGFESPGPDIDAKKIAAGKTIFNLPSNSSVPFVQQIQSVFLKLAGEVGASVKSWPNQGQHAQWVEGMDTAISGQADLIQLLTGPDPYRIMPQVEEAKAAGIPVVDSHDIDFSQQHSDNVAAYVDGHYTRAGELIAAWTILQTKGNANALIVTSNDFKNSIPVAEGMEKEFAADCPDCKIKKVNVNIADWPTQMQSTVQGEMISNQDLNYILPTFDSAITYITPAIQATNSVGRVHVASFNGSADILDLVRAGDIVTMDVGENPSYIAAATLDQDLRVLGGQEPSEDEHMVMRVFTKDNVAEAGVPATLGEGYGNDWRAGYLRTWGMD